MTLSTRRFSPNLMFILLFAGVTSVSAQTEPFAILTDDEIASHTATMAGLEGQAKEDYRNAQYQMLQQRAAKQGYAMPDTPPWQARAETLPASAAQTASASAAGPADEAAAAHAAMREKMRAHREALLEAANSPPPAADTPPATALSGAQGPVAPTQAANAPMPAPAPAMQPPTVAPVPPPTLSGESATPQQTANTAPTPPVAAKPPQQTPSITAAPPTAPVAPQQPPDIAATPPMAPAAPKPPQKPSNIATPPSIAVTSPSAAAPVEQAPTGSAATNKDAPIPMARIQVPTNRTAPVAPEPPAAPPSPARPAGGQADVATMNAYREEMRKRFDTYMQQRQTQMEELARQQREAAGANNRPAPPMQPSPVQPRPTPYGYPNMPAYGPRYPSAYPGYRTPYWQQ